MINGSNNIVDDFTSEYYETISSKIHVANGSELMSNYRLKSVVTKKRGDNSPKCLNNAGMGGVKRVTVDLFSPNRKQF